MNVKVECPVCRAEQNVADDRIVSHPAVTGALECVGSGMPLDPEVQQHRMRALSFLRERLPVLAIPTTVDQATAAAYILSWIATHPTEFGQFDRQRWTDASLFAPLFERIDAYTGGDLTVCCPHPTDFAFLFGTARAAYLLTKGTD